VQPPPGVPLLQVAIEGPLPGLIADLFSIQSDIQFARHCAAGYLARAYDAGQPAGPDKGPEQSLIAKAMWSAALISYRRAFGSGRGHLVPKAQRFDIKGLREQLLNPEQLEADTHLREMIDQHVAHRVSDLEQVKYLVLLTPPPLPRQVVGVSPMMIHMIGPEAAVAQSLIEICDILLPAIGQQINTFGENQREALNREHIDRLYTEAEAQSARSSSGQSTTSTTLRGDSCGKTLDA
jgi:hypothetical protein